MSSLLGNIDSMPVDSLPKKVSRKRKPSPLDDSDSEPSPKHNGKHSYRQKLSYNDFSSDPPIDDSYSASSDDAFASPNKRFRKDDHVMTPAADRLAELDVHSSSDYDTTFDDINMDDFMDIDFDEDIKSSVKKEQAEVSIPKKPTQTSRVVKNEESDAKPAWLSVYDSLAVETEDTLGPLSTSNNNASNPSNLSALESDRSLRFYWLDYLELDGKLYFIGKFKEKTTDTWMSCCVTVENMERNLFVLPREKRVEQDEGGALHETDIVPSPEDVDDDFDLMRQQLKIKSYRSKFVKRKYAFGEKDIPRGETQWMKVVYGYNG